MNKKIISIAFVIALLTLAGIVTYQSFFIKDVVYVDIGRLVDNYRLKKELEKKAETDLLKIKNVIDSLKLAGRLTDNRSIDSNVARLEYQFGQYYTQSSQEISRQIWDRLNPVIDAFGKERKYKVIIGANGAGNVLYGDKRYDITDELILYINNKYEKGN